MRETYTTFVFGPQDFVKVKGSRRPNSGLSFLQANDCLLCRSRGRLGRLSLCLKLGRLGRSLGRSLELLGVLSQLRQLCSIR